MAGPLFLQWVHQAQAYVLKYGAVSAVEEIARKKELLEDNTEGSTRTGDVM